MSNPMPTALRRLLLAVLLFATALAHADGLWRFTFTPCNLQASGPNGTTQGSFATYPNSDSCSYFGGVGGDSGSTSASASGTIQVSAYWDPNGSGEPAPDTVIVAEGIDVDAQYSSSYPTGTVSVGDGLGGTPSVSDEGEYEEVDDSRYSVVHPDANGALPTITIDPSASVTGYYAGITVRYSVFIIPPPTIQLTGGSTTTPGNYLIGQRLSASVVMPPGGFSPSASGSTPAYQWSLSGGGSPFKSFGVTTTTTQYGPYQVTDSASHFTPLAASDYTTSSFGCSFAQPGSPTVSCAVHFAVPSGSLPAGGLDATLNAPVRIFPPQYVQAVQLAKGTVTLLQQTSTAADDGALALGGDNGTGGLGPNYKKTRGIEYRSEIATPSEYAQSSDQGGFVWVQLVQLGTTRGLSDASTQTEVCNPPQRGTWTFGLDTSYPYEPTSLVGQHTVAESSVGNMYIADGGGLDANGNGTVAWPCEAGDTPREPLHNQDAWTPPNGFGVQSYHIREDFTVVQLYKAPGNDSQFVPVQSFHWYWGGDCTHPSITITPVDVVPTNPSPDATFRNAMDFDSYDGWVLNNPVHDFDSITPLTSVAFPSWAQAQQASYFLYIASGH